MPSNPIRQRAIPKTALHDHHVTDLRNRGSLCPRMN
jgi:hypothetical protein